MRLDIYLVQHKGIESRTKAQELIIQGLVLYKGKIIKKPSFDVIEENPDNIKVEENNLSQYVSRAGFKLAAALIHVKQSVSSLKILDVGQSTGGFSDVLLQNGAQSITGIDVGSDQLHPKIKNDSRVRYFENINIKDIATHIVAQEQYDGVVCDVSFISLAKVVSFIEPLLKTKGFFLFLVKPQFECGPQALDNNGIVRDSSVYVEIRNNLTALCKTVFNTDIEYFESAITGKDGNREFFIYGKKL